VGTFDSERTSWARGNKNCGVDPEGLLAPDEILTVADLVEGVAKVSGVQPIAYGVAVHADGFGRGGGRAPGGEQGDGALLGRS
jgi:hypothetical protein